MHAVHKSIWSEPSNFTSDGFLTIGFAGHQSELADWYFNNGSMYIGAEVSWRSACLPRIVTGPRLIWTGRKRRHAPVAGFRRITLSHIDRRNTWSCGTSLKILLF
jgi:hypothetical protein